METREVTIPLDNSTDVSGVLAVPASYRQGASPAALVAHGAGGDMDHDLMVAMATGLCAAGYATLRFNFPYRERGESRPDSGDVLRATLEAATRYLNNASDLAPASVAMIGKSMGGAAAAQLAAERPEFWNALVFLGYPLHRAGHPESPHGEVFTRIGLPMLFVEGTRDPLCDLDSLRDLLGRGSINWTIHEVPEGDHSFRLPSGSAKSRPQVHGEIVVATRDWLSGLW